MKIPVSIEPDEEGYIGRECPVCKKYFKVKFGTGLHGVTDCYCPYCNHKDSQDNFWTRQQIEYAKSIALNQVTSDLLKSLKKLERRPKPNQLISIGITVKGQPTPIIYYSEEELEQKVTCNQCTLEYAIYGAFGYCPDCGIHNSKQIVSANFDLILRILALSVNAEGDIKSKLIENSLEDAVSAFDGFGREHYSSAYPQISFQSISFAQTKILTDSQVDISSGLSPKEWDFVVEQFQKRHLIAHKMGIIDDEFIRKTGTSSSLVGRKVSITEEDVRKFISYLLVITDNLLTGIPRS